MGSIVPKKVITYRWVLYDRHLFDSHYTNTIPHSIVVNGSYGWITIFTILYYPALASPGFHARHPASGSICGARATTPVDLQGIESSPALDINMAYVYIYIYLCVCMDGWTDGWMDGWMYACMHGCMDAWMHGCMDVWMYGCMDVWMDVWMYVCMYKYMNISIYEYMYIYIYYIIN